MSVISTEGSNLKFLGPILFRSDKQGGAQLIF